MIELSGLWKGTTKDGEVYYSGKLGKVRILVFKNDKRGNDKAPDLRLLIAEDRKREGGGSYDG